MELTDKLTAIADAIRARTGKTDLMTLDNMCIEINSISSNNSEGTVGAVASNTLTIITENDLMGATSISRVSFWNRTNLTKVAIPEGVSSIGETAFYGCTSITEVSIGKDVQSIAKNAFRNLPKLSRLTFYGETPPTLVRGTMEDSFDTRSLYASDLVIYVPANAMSEYTKYFSTNVWTLQAISE